MTSIADAGLASASISTVPGGGATHSAEAARFNLTPTSCDEGRMPSALRITLNGDSFELDAPLTVTELLARLGIDARRVAVEHNLVVVKHGAFDATVVQDGDQVEIVNFVGGG